GVALSFLRLPRQPGLGPPAAPEAPTIFLGPILLHDPMMRAPARAARCSTAAKDDPAAIVVMAPVAADHGMAGRTADDHDAAMAENGFGGIVIAVGQAVERRFVADEHRLVAAAEPESIAAVVGLVAEVCVARTPRL